MNFNSLAPKNIVDKTKDALVSKGYEVFVVDTGKEALEKIKQIIPKGASVMNGASVTLEQIGFVDYLKSGKLPWNNLHEKILAEKDPSKQSKLRKQSALSDYYLGSVHALTEKGEFIIASNSSSQLPHIVFTSPNLIFVVSTKKIVPNLTDGMKRLEEYVFPLENEHMKKLYNVGSNISKIVTFKDEPQFLGRKIRFILVNEDLGF